MSPYSDQPDMVVNQLIGLRASATLQPSYAIPSANVDQLYHN